MTTESETTPTGRVDRGAVMTEARRRFAVTRKLGWSWGRTLAYSWGKLKRQAAQTRQA